jgi:hypothetical protein
LVGRDVKRVTLGYDNKFELLSDVLIQISSCDCDEQIKGIKSFRECNDG